MTEIEKQTGMTERRILVGQLIRDGYRSARPIAEALADRYGIDAHFTTIARDMQALEADFKEIAKDTIDENRGVMVTRHEERIRVLSEMLEEPDLSIREKLATIRLMNETDGKLRTLLGLDMPSKIAHTNPSGDKEYTGIPDEFKRKYLGMQPEEETIEEAEVIEETLE
jgi:hypothetical protein